MELTAAGGLLVWLILRGVPTIQHEESIFCEIGLAPHYYVCSGHPQEFYLVVCFVSMIIISLYMFCCFYNLLWMFVPACGSLSGAMRTLKQEFRTNRYR